jgi:transposase
LLDSAGPASAYRRASGRCTYAPAQAALRAANDAMLAMDPPLLIYHQLRQAITPALSNGAALRRDAISLGIWRRIRPLLPKAERACGRLDAWRSKNAPLSNPDVAEALRWLRDWYRQALSAKTPAEELRCIKAVLYREHAVLSRPARRKKPRFIAPSLTLTSRGKEDWRQRAKLEQLGDSEDESEPLESRVSSGRLTRAIRIFADIRQGTGGR